MTRTSFLRCAQTAATEAETAEAAFRRLNFMRAVASAPSVLANTIRTVRPAVRDQSVSIADIAGVILRLQFPATTQSKTRRQVLAYGERKPLVRSEHQQGRCQRVGVHAATMQDRDGRDAGRARDGRCADRSCATDGARRARSSADRRPRSQSRDRAVRRSSRPLAPSVRPSSDCSTQPTTDCPSGLVPRPLSSPPISTRWSATPRPSRYADTLSTAKPFAIDEKSSRRPPGWNTRAPIEPDPSANRSSPRAAAIASPSGTARMPMRAEAPQHRPAHRRSDRRRRPTLARPRPRERSTARKSGGSTRQVPAGAWLNRLMSESAIHGAHLRDHAVQHALDAPVRRCRARRAPVRRT